MRAARASSAARARDASTDDARARGDATRRARDATALPGRAVTTDARAPTTVARDDANARAVKRYRDRQRDARARLEAECAALRADRERLEAELAHARWVLDAVASRYGMKRRARGRDADAALSRSVVSVIAHGAGCPLGRAGGGPFRLDAEGERARGDATSTSEDELAEFLNEFLVHEDGKCPCPGHAR